MSKPLKWNIPGIKRILAVNVHELPVDVRQRNEVGLPIFISCDAEDVPFVGVPVCEIAETHRKYGVDYECKLNFVAQCPVLRVKPTAWIVIDNAGSATLLGENSKIIPLLKIGRSTGEFSSRRGVSHEVTCITPPAECICVCDID